MISTVIDVAKYVIKKVAQRIKERWEAKKLKAEEVEKYRASQETFRNKKRDEFKEVHAHEYYGMRNSK